MFLTQNMCNEAVEKSPWMLERAPDQYKTQEMCNRAVEKSPRTLKFFPDYFVTQEMCHRTVEKDAWVLEHVPDQYKTQEMYNEAVQSDPEVLEYVPDQFVTLQEMWYDEFDDDDVLITWRDAYIKCKSQKAKIKEELMPVAWRPDRWWNWCVSEHEKKN